MSEASITDRNDGGRYCGQTPESIARRVWGRRAKLWYSPDPNSRVGSSGWLGMVVREDRYGTHVLADVVIRTKEN